MSKFNRKEANDRALSRVLCSDLYEAYDECGSPEHYCPDFREIANKLVAMGWNNK